jgi:thioesterase domain-containing protein
MPLASELAGSYAVHGIEAVGFSDPSISDAPLPDVITKYVDAIVKVQPAGPYHLAGWSIGGLLAYEIICRLEERGEKAAFLVTLDSPFAVPEDIVQTEPVLASQFAADATRTLGLEVDPPDPQTTTVADELEWLAAQMGTDGSDPQQLCAELQRRFEVFKANKAMLSGYQPETVVHTDALVIAAQQSPNVPAQPLWRSIIDGQVSLVSLECHHHELLHPPWVQEVAAAILAFAGASP